MCGGPPEQKYSELANRTRHCTKDGGQERAAGGAARGRRTPLARRGPKFAVRAAEQPFSDLRKAGRAGAVLAPALGRLDRAWRALVPALQDLVAEDLPPVEEDAAPAAAGAPAAPPPTGPACKAQVDLPNDDDLANWSHHASVATTGDEVLKSAMAGSALVSFVFGMEVTADLVRAHAAS